MEVLPSSNVQRGGESGFPQQESVKTYIFDENTNCTGRTEVQVMDVQVNDLTLNGEGSHFEQGGDKWTIAESSTSEGHDNDDSFFEFEMDGQNSEDQYTRGSLASENSQLYVETIVSEFPSTGREEAPWPEEVKWPEPEEAMAVWVKWRGMWQAGIQCARADWPLATLKAKPTHDRKKYIVVFFPRRRNYSWADVLLVRPINEFPEPIPYRTHKVGAKMVRDLTIARRFIIQKLAVGILNIIDQLHSEALLETARNVVIWKEFAMEASHCKDYSDIGRLLLKLQSMIAQFCFDSSWLHHSLESWKHRCKNANSAEYVEMLKEELVDSILWNEINSFTNGSVQSELNFEWKTWKQEMMKSFSMSHPIANGRDVVQPSDVSQLGVELQISSKRPKLVVRRAEAHTSHVETQCPIQSLNTEIDTGFMYCRNIVDPDTSEMKHTGAEAPPMGADRWGEIVIEAGSTEIIQTKDVNLTPVNGVATRPFNASSKSNQCAAFIESKGRQCVRWANDGDVYCCVHLASRLGGNSPNLEASTSDAILCGGTTVLGTKCKHRALNGTPFCKKHRPQNDEVIMPSTPNSKKRKHEESIHTLKATSCKDIVFGGDSATALQLDSVSFKSRDGSYEKSIIKMPEQSSRENSGTEVLHCIGPVSEEANDNCLESPKKHFLYCEKHLPSWLKRARNGKTRIVSKEVYMDLLRECHSREQKLHLHHACELFHRFFKSILSIRNPAPKENQIQWAITEASKDARVGELLMKLVLREKDRLEKLWGFTADKDPQNCSSVEDPVALPIVVANDSGHDDSEIKCKICSNNFCDDQSLGKHWMDSHRKEAQWLFRGYACAICLDSFTNKKVLESHVQERHHAKFVEQCLLLQCIPCGNHFGNADELWSHVLSLHTSSFKTLGPSQQHDATTIGEDFAHELEAAKLVSVENINTDNQGVSRKFICKFCGLKFDLLPDLGRHHQAAHMGANPVASNLLKRGISFYAYKFKTGRLVRPRFKKSKGAASYKIRNRAGATMKKRIQLSSSIIAGELKDQIHGAESDKLGGLVEFQCSNVAKMLYSEITQTKPRPSNLEILSFARSACCKAKLQNLLEENYGILPERLYLKAAKLCSEHNIVVYWHQDGFICPSQCKRITVQNPVTPLFPFPDESRSRLALPPVPKATEWEVDECHCIVDSRHFKQEPILRTIILCDDISFGQETVPIACVVDENLLGSLPILVEGSNDQSTKYSMPWEGFRYVRKPLVDRSLAVNAESLQLGCACGDSTCSSETCDHVYLFDNDYEDAKDKYGKPMKGRFPYDDKGRIILEEGYMVYECNQNCHCSRTCQNRVLQNGVQVKLEVYKTEEKGWAVRACEQILRGRFVCEYIGEVIDEQEATIRRKRYSEEGCNYLYEIDAHSNDMSRLIEEQDLYVIDATTYGNVSRYINHSCLPNLTNHQVIVESMDCQLAHIGLYASRDIAIGEELTYDYRYKQLPGEGCQCLCGAPNCKGRLY
ncbi:hypothetical protein DCAR_0312437 [Daucus carota subsp. sativus]|uniref:Histone-lysine N-methyltransferase SUVR5 n=1 Tax=Daucus carota subsp. sativus TaxID=79200 RepID=A0A166B0S5_DAUCS|nr:PREDICTED: histone-lysine N-methyltransferase SUVR5 [Daucus carota subsp. sativus]XP_017241689.1 PREDICTED: histone-lysine N-methyltransferase SUVR5 [Daucus carota subsp. sativus]XP_017241690.1 PREDICTED: histone-lysine N-methyltransferase SUVR5 [Daucus carota subsp. sativus]XP_017241691.1 PREDICTED: histone-lysine N-methyltransferase SUVR5 [Daucus carota subsp. sativus]WOG93156.1 hypothetical protein DCAR_0312437 [Daucus carota subsp. sativus]